MKEKNRIYGGVIALTSICLMVFTTGCSVKASGSTEEAETTAVQSVREIDAWGEVKYQDSYQINIDFPSTVESVTVKEGDVVHKGDVLGILNIDEFHNTIAKIENQKAAGEAVLAGIDQNTAGLEAQMKQQRRNITVAQNDLNSAQQLYNAGDIAKTEYDRYVTNLDGQKTSLKVLEVQLEQLKKSNSSNLSQQTSSNEALQKELDIYKGRMNKAYLNGNQIVSNVDNGIIKSISVENGTILGSELGQKTVMEIIDQDSIYISAEVDEEYIREIDLNTTVRIVPVMNPELEFKGTVSQISAMAVEKDGGRIIKVQVIPEDEHQVMKPGYTVDVYFKR